MQGADVHKLNASEVPFSEDYGRDDYLRGLGAIDDSIAVGDQLAQVFGGWPTFTLFVKMGITSSACALSSNPPQRLS